MSTTDVLTEAEARRVVNVDEGSPVLTQLVTAVSQQLDQMCGPIVQRTITSESHDGGGRAVSLKYRPVASVTEVTEYDGTVSTALTAETNSAKATANYFVDLTAGVVMRRSNGWDDWFPVGRGNVVVTYVAGRAATTGAVDAKFKQAAGMMLRNVWTGEVASGTESFGPFADGTTTASLLGPGLLNKVVAMLQNEIIDGVAVL